MDLNEQWRTPEQQQAIEGISRPTFFRRLKQGEYETNHVPSPKGGGKGGKQLLVRPKNQPSKKHHPDRYRVNPGEPGNSVVTEFRNAVPVAVTSNAGEAARVVDQLIKDRKALSFQREELLEQILKPRSEGSPDFTVNPGLPSMDREAPGAGHLLAFTPLKAQTGPGTLVERGDSPNLALPSVAGNWDRPGLLEIKDPPAQSPDSGLPQVYKSTRENLPDSGVRRNDKLERIANLRYALIQAFKAEVEKNHRPRTEIVSSFLDLYNTDFILPAVHEELGGISRSTLYSWQQLYEQGGVDGLVPQYGGSGVSKITPAEKEFIRGKILNPNKPTIGDTINKCKFLLGEESPSSPSTLRRWLNDFRKQNYDLWVLEREGEKALNDKCVPYAEREWRDLAVGQIVVADGHKLNFQVVNPFTGKPCRAVMVLFWDWKSAYPLGWEIMLTESIQCVVSALRNAIITLGKFPEHALLDNGKAFRANIFTKKFRFQETEIPGIFDRLSIRPHFSLAYNAQAKPIERFFRTFNDWFEREMISYSGSSIPDKPPRMLRNEKRAKMLYDDRVPTIEETMRMIFQWREYYADQELKARDYQRPRDIFEAEKGPGVDPFALHYLMMTCKARMVHRNGITFNGWHWYHESLYGIKDHVFMFYSYYDLGQVYIFTQRNEQLEFLCVAKPVEKVKPFAADSEFPEDMAAVNQIRSLQNRAKRQTKALADTLRANQTLQIDWNRKFRNDPAVVEAIEKIEAEKKPKVINLSEFAAKVEPEAPAEEEKPFQFSSAWERYEFHLKGGVFKGTEMDRQFMEDYRSGKIAPEEWEANYGRKAEAI